jgi:hypothetical protein
VKITTVWPFFFVETTRARGGYFDMFWYYGTVRVPQYIEFAAENLPAGWSIYRPSFEFVWNPWTTPFQTAGLGSTDLSRGFRVPRISHFWMSVEWNSDRNRVCPSNAQTCSTSTVWQRVGGGSHKRNSWPLPFQLN